MNVLALFKPIEVFIFDIDGVLTNGQLLLSREGMLRTMNVKDGFALQWAVKSRYEIVVISGGGSEQAVDRLKKLGIDLVFVSVSDKVALLKELKARRGWETEKMLYMGDDIPDYECMQLCGLAACPKDAVPEIQSLSHYISPFSGGEGCVRDVIEKVLKLQGNWPVIEPK